MLTKAQFLERMYWQVQPFKDSPDKDEVENLLYLCYGIGYEDGYGIGNADGYYEGALDGLRDGYEN